MSAFLGPVHHWMYRKIILQEQLTDRLLQLAAQNGWAPGLAAQLEQAYSKAEDVALESIIDASNIHGWLSARVASAEARFADAVRTLLEPDQTRLSSLETLFEAAGHASSIAPQANLEAAYQVVDGLLLDGMPCDGGRRVTSQDEDSIVWSYDPALHPLCQDANGKTAFFALREAFLRGVLAGSGLRLQPLGEAVYRLERGA